MAEELTHYEKFLRRVESLALSALDIPDGILASSPNHHDGVMVALAPDSPENFAIQGENTLTSDDLHITLCYLGKAQDLDSFDKAHILSVAHNVCNTAGASFSSAADGVVVMGSNDEGVPATALLIQADEIVNLYEVMSEALGYVSRYPTFIPHMTVGYGLDVEKAQHLLGKPIEFKSVVVKFGDEKHTISLPSSLVAAPRGANVIDRVLDSLGRLWDEALHPRGDDGRFIKKNGAISGKLAVPSKDGRGVEMVDANRASVVGFHTFDNDVWVLAEITNQDGSKEQGFAKAIDVRAVAPVKARLDALYPVEPDTDNNTASIERNRQIDLLLAYINKEYLVNGDEEGTFDFLETLGLRESDLDYMFDGGDDELTGLRIVNRDLSEDERDEVQDIIGDVQEVKRLRDRVRGMQTDEHVVPKQNLPEESTDNIVNDDAIDALQSGADPLSLNVSNLLTLMELSGRFEMPEVTSGTGISEIGWFVDENDQTGVDAHLAGTGKSTTGRAYFIKQSVFGADSDNIDIVNEVMVSLIAEQIEGSVGEGDDRLLPIPKSVFGDNPVWDGNVGEDRGPFSTAVHQPAHVISSHAAYAVPSDWKITTAADEETKLQNDIRRLDPSGQADAQAAHKEDMGDIYGNSVAQMILWDYVTMNSDRNANNALLAYPENGEEGRVLPIDHGFAFADGILADIHGVTPESMNEASMFDLFLEEDLTKGWLDYVLGGLDLNNNVTEETLQKVVADFIDTYGQIDTEKILSEFKAIEGVSGGQIRKMEAALVGVQGRIKWLAENKDEVLRRLTTR